MERRPRALKIMKIATFNINGVNKRLENLLAWLATAEPDIVCLQELKATDGNFRGRSKPQATVRPGADSRPGTALPSSPAIANR